MLRLAPLILLLASCAGTPEPSPEPETATKAGPDTNQEIAVPEPEPSLCNDLTKIIDGRYLDFKTVRGPANGARQFKGNVIPRNFQTCNLHGRRSETARYICTSSSQLGDSIETISGEFDRMASKIRACLGRPNLAVDQWRAAEPIKFADDEQLMVWRATGRRPRQEISLKMERKFSTGAFYLRLEIAPRRDRLNLSSAIPFPTENPLEHNHSQALWRLVHMSPFPRQR